MKNSINLTVITLLALLGWLFLATPATVHAQFMFTTNADNTITITGYTGTNLDVVIPSTIEGMPVTSIIGNTNTEVSGFPQAITSVIIPNSATHIGDYAFFDCANLTSVTMGTNVATIGVLAFSGPAFHAFPGPIIFVIGCPLTSVTIPNSVASIGEGAFCGCSDLTSLSIGNGVTNIDESAFLRCERLTSVFFQGNAPTVGAYVFGFTNSGYVTFDPATAFYLPGTTGWDAFATNAGIPVAVWQPQIQPASGTFGVNSNQFGFNVNWANGMTVVVEASPTLLGGTWTPLVTNTLSGASFYFTNPEWTNYPSRFYRVRSQ